MAIAYVYIPIEPGDAIPGVPARDLTDEDVAALPPALRRQVTSPSFGVERIYVPIDQITETEQERLDRLAAEAAARAAEERLRKPIYGYQFYPWADNAPTAEELVQMQADVAAVADVPAQVDALETTVAAKADASAVAAVAADVDAVEVTAGRLAYRVYDPDAYGAVRGTGRTSAERTATTAAINQAAEDARLNDGVLVIKGTYEIDGTVEARCHVDATLGRLEVADTSLAPAFRFGGLAANSADRRLAILPEVIQTGKTVGTGVWGTGIGVEVRSVRACSIVVPHVQNFGVGLRIASSAGGCSYNAIEVGHLRNNQVNLDIAPTSPGWCNENRFLGPFRLSIESTEGTNIPGVRHIRMTGYGTGSGANNCTFYSPSLEGDGPQYHIEMTLATDNMVIQGRYEASAGCRVRLIDTLNTVFLYGYDAKSLQITESGTSRYNHVYTRNGIRMVGTDSKGVLVLENYGSDGYPVLAAMLSGSGFAANPATAYQAAISASFSRYKAAADAYPRIEVNHALGRILMGTGTAAPTAFFRAWGPGIRFDTMLIALNGLGVGNSVAATTPGTVVRKMEVFDGNGTSLGFIPIYNAIT